MESGQPDPIARDFKEEDINGRPHIDDDAENALQRIKTSGTGSVTISSDLFEKLYLQPKFTGPVLKHPLQKVLGNPTGLAIIGFEMSLMPVTMQLMEWRGATGTNTTQTTNVIFFGGVLMWISGLLEFVLGNTFPFLVFTAFGSFYASYGAMMIPWFNTYEFFASPNGPATTGLTTMAFNASYGHFWAAFTILMFFFFICSFRTNVVFVYMFASIFAGVACITGIYYQAANGNMDAAHDCQIAAGAILFTTCIVGWYLFAALIFPSVDFPIPIPLGDLQQVVPGLSDLSTGKKGWSLFRRRQGHEKAEDAAV